MAPRAARGRVVKRKAGGARCRSCRHGARRRWRAKKRQYVGDGRSQRDRRLAEIVCRVAKVRLRVSGRSRHGRASGVGLRETAPPARGEDVARWPSAVPGLTSRMAAGGSGGRGAQALAYPGHQRRAPRQTHRHVGAERPGEIEQLVLGHDHMPKIDELAPAPRRHRPNRRPGRPPPEYACQSAIAARGRHAGALGQQARPPSAPNLSGSSAQRGRMRARRTRATGDQAGRVTSVSARSTKPTSEFEQMIAIGPAARRRSARD